MTVLYRSLIDVTMVGLEWVTAEREVIIPCENRLSRNTLRDVSLVSLGQILFLLIQPSTERHRTYKVVE